MARSLAPFLPEDPIRFTLARSMFSADPDPSPETVLAMVVGVSADKRGYRTYDMGALLRVVHAEVPEAEHRRLRSVLVNKHRPVTAPVLGRLVIWLAEQTMGRPMVPSGGWSAGRRMTGATSAATC